jgi:hypothetical protein
VFTAVAAVASNGCITAIINATMCSLLLLLSLPLPIGYSVEDGDADEDYVPPVMTWPPSFLAGDEHIRRPEGSGPVNIPSWAYNIQLRPNGLDVLAFVVECTSEEDGLFAVNPEIKVGSGDLSFTPESGPNKFGTADCTTVLKEQYPGGLQSDPWSFVIVIEPGM